jgi:hypothetical protein
MKKVLIMPVLAPALFAGTSGGFQLINLPRCS